MDTVVPMTERPARSDVGARIIGLIDLTDLDDAHSSDGLATLVERAVECAVPAVCIWPEFVGDVDGRLRATGSRSRCRIATVVNFPDGDGSIDDVDAETRRALDDGADEIDLVLPYRPLASGDAETARAMVETIAKLAHSRTGPFGEPVLSKVILETGELSAADIATAARLAVDAGADFLKTSTGKTPVSATLPAFELLLDAVEIAARSGRTVGVKPSGGIRTVAEAARYLDVVGRRFGPDWATPRTFRFGASSLLDDAIG